MTDKKKKSSSKVTKTDLEQQIGELTADLQRIQADFVNFKQRAEEDQHRAVNIGKEAAITALLPVIDNVQRALGNVPKDLKGNEFVTGIEAVSKQLMGSLNQIGVEKIETENAEFDPELMEAVQLEEGKGKKEMVIQEMQSGYTLNGNVIRHAMVRVGKK